MPHGVCAQKDASVRQMKKPIWNLYRRFNKQGNMRRQNQH